MRSHHPVDAAQGYCGNCHRFTGGLDFPRKVSWWKLGVAVLAFLLVLQFAVNLLALLRHL